MKKGILLIACLVSVYVSAATWSFSGGYIYFDNSQTQWTDECFMLVIGKADYSSVYEMCPIDNPQSGKAQVTSNWWYTALPSSGWSDAEYMAIITGSKPWRKGTWGQDNLVNANHYAVYTAGLTAKANQGFQFAVNDHTLKLTYLDDSYHGVSFTDAEKNACYKLDATNQTITFIFSTSAKRFNTSRSAVSRVYTYGSVTAWDQTDEAYRLNGFSDDGCFFRAMPLSAIERIGNSGQPEFLFNIIKYGDNYSEQDGYTDRAHSSWTDVDIRLLFDNNGVNMIVALPGDDLDEIHSRSIEAQKVDKVADIDLTNPAEEARIANWRRVPNTKHLFRSYHPYDPTRANYDTEERRLYWVAQLATQAGINCDIALSGDCTGHAGRTYTCGGKSYTITIPDYYQTIISNNRVLYVGTINGHTPSYSDVLYKSNGERFAQWIQETVNFILDDAHPVPFQIHCALGSDRTGAFCATIAALCDATWDDIAADYEATSKMHVNEYRHRNCIRYCLRHMCGIDPATDPSFNEAVKQHFIDGGWLTAAQIDALKHKLNGETTDLESINTATAHNNLQPVATKRLIDGMLYIQISSGSSTSTFSPLGHLLY